MCETNNELKEQLKDDLRKTLKEQKNQMKE